MARPVKNSCDYFPHDNGMRNHRKVKALRQKFQNGYAIWCMFLEFLTGADGNEFEKTDLELEMLSGDFGFSVTEISDVLNYCISIEMLFDKNGFVYSESLNERLAPVYLKRGKAKELSQKQQRKNGKFVSNNTEQTVVSVTETPQSKVKEIKENKIKRFIIPTIWEISEYCKERNNKVDAEKFYNFYTSKGWMVGKNKMKDWQAAVRNWEKDCKPEKTLGL